MASAKEKDIIIDNEKYKEYYRQYFPLIKSALRKFYYLMDEDDLESCGMHALLRCMKSWKPERKVKFSSLLVNYVNWECGIMLKQLNKYRDVACAEIRIKEDNHCKLEIRDILLSLTDKEAELFCDRFMSKFTLAQIAEKYRVCRETIRKRLISIKNKIRENEEAEVQCGRT